MVMLLRRIGPSPDFSSCLRPCSDDHVISEQRIDFVASLLRIGIVRCDLVGVSHDLLMPRNGGTVRPSKRASASRSHSGAKDNRGEEADGIAEQRLVKTCCNPIPPPLGKSPRLHKCPHLHVRQENAAFVDPNLGAVAHILGWVLLSILSGV